MQARYLVLGGRGFLGSHVVDSLLSKGASVRILDRPAPAGARLFFPGTNPHLLQVVEGDFTNHQDLQTAMDGCDICVHTITTTLPKTSNDDVAFDVSTNLLGTIKLLDYAVTAGLKKLVFLSSGGTVYGPPLTHDLAEDHPTDPISSYGITKLAIEKYLALYEHLHGLQAVSLRISNPFGPRQRIDGAQGAIAAFLGLALRNRPIQVWGDGSAVRDYLHVKDVVSAIEAACAYTGDERIFNIGSGIGRSLLEVLDAIELATNRKILKNFVEGRSFDVRRNVLDISRANRELKWRPEVEFYQGVSDTATWIERELRLGNFSATVLR